MCTTTVRYYTFARGEAQSKRWQRLPTVWAPSTLKRGDVGIYLVQYMCGFKAAPNSDAQQKGADKRVKEQGVGALSALWVVDRSLGSAGSRGPGGDSSAGPQVAAHGQTCASTMHRRT